MRLRPRHTFVACPSSSFEVGGRPSGPEPSPVHRAGPAHGRRGRQRGRAPSRLNGLVVRSRHRRTVEALHLLLGGVPERWRKTTRATCPNPSGAEPLNPPETRPDRGSMMSSHHQIRPERPPLAGGASVPGSRRLRHRKPSYRRAVFATKIGDVRLVIDYENPVVSAIVENLGRVFPVAYLCTPLRVFSLRTFSDRPSRMPRNSQPLGEEPPLLGAAVLPSR